MPIVRKRKNMQKTVTPFRYTSIRRSRRNKASLSVPMFSTVRVVSDSCGTSATGTSSWKKLDFDFVLTRAISYRLHAGTYLLIRWSPLTQLPWLNTRQTHRSKRCTNPSKCTQYVEFDSIKVFCVCVSHQRTEQLKSDWQKKTGRVLPATEQLDNLATWKWKYDVGRAERSATNNPTFLSLASTCFLSKREDCIPLGSHDQLHRRTSGRKWSKVETCRLTQGLLLTDVVASPLTNNEFRTVRTKSIPPNAILFLHSPVIGLF